jgi:F-box domain
MVDCWFRLWRPNRELLIWGSLAPCGRKPRDFLRLGLTHFIRMRRTRLDTLPDDVLLDILLYLSVVDILCLKQVCAILSRTFWLPDQ